MAFYNNTTTEIYNSVFDQSKYRSEFRLTPDKFYLSNMRILNLGLHAVDVGEKRYNLVNGAGAVVKNIYLYDGAVVLDKIINYGDFSAFQAYNKSNQYNSDVAKILMRNGLGFVWEREPNTNGGETQVCSIKETFPNCPHTPRPAEKSALGFLKLNEVFPLLKSLQFLHTGLFKNLRVVIEYNVDGSAVGTGIADVFATSLPILVADSLTNQQVADKWLKEFKGINWISNEIESVQVKSAAEAAITDGVQNIKYRLTGALNKTVNYVLIQKKLPSTSTYKSALYGNHASETMFNETYQLAVNGSSLLPNDGIKTANERLALLHDTFSVCNTHTCASSLPMYNADEFVDIYGSRCGRLDYFGCIVNKQLDSLDLLYSREISNDTSFDARYKSALTLNVFYGVVKSIVLDGKGNYQVMYV